MRYYDIGVGWDWVKKEPIGYPGGRALIGQEDPFTIIKQELAFLKAEVIKKGFKFKDAKTGKEGFRFIQNSDDTFLPIVNVLKKEPDAIVFTQARINRLNKAIADVMGDIRTTQPGITVAKVATVQSLSDFVPGLETIKRIKERAVLPARPKLPGIAIGVALLGLIAAFAGILAKGIR